MHKHFKYFLTAMVAVVLLPSIASADPEEVKIPSTVNYYARLKDSDGKPITGRVAVRTFLYDSATGGMPGDLDDEHLIYAEDHGEVNVTKGRLALTLGAGEPMGPFSGSSLPIRGIAETGGLFLELQIGTERVSPRQWIGFAGSSYEAAYAGRATNLSGPLSITTSSFPSNMSAGKLNCGGSNGHIAPERLPSIPSTTITTGDIDLAQVPSGIPLSKMVPSDDRWLAPDLLPNVSALKIQTGTFGAAELPSNIIGSLRILKDADAIPDGGSTAISGANCHCMAALHSTRDGGRQDMNTMNISMPLTGGTIGCMMTFDAASPLACNASYMCVCLN